MLRISPVTITSPATIFMGGCCRWFKLEWYI